MKAPVQVRAIVFDMDGVLIDSHPVHHAAWQQFLRSVSIHLDHSDLAYILEGRTRNEILRHFLGELPPAQLEEYGRRKDEIFRNLEHSIRPAPGVLDFLRELERRGLARAVATSASEIRTASTLERLGMSSYFDAVVTAGDVSAGKPHPEVYQLACAGLNVQPQQALAFDDAPAGVQAARSAGMQCIGVTSNGRSNALLGAGAERVINSFAGLEMNSVLADCLAFNDSRPMATQDNEIQPRDIEAE